MVRMHIFQIFSFLAKMLSSLSRNDNIFARNENIGKICKRTITWTDFILSVDRHVRVYGLKREHSMLTRTTYLIKHLHILGERPLMTSHVFGHIIPTYLVLLYNVRLMGLCWTPLPTLISDVIDGRSLMQGPGVQVNFNKNASSRKILSHFGTDWRQFEGHCIVCHCILETPNKNTSFGLNCSL